MPVESSAGTGFHANIPAAELEAGIVGLAGKTILYMRDHRADTCFGERIQFKRPGLTFMPVPAFYKINEQEIGAIVQVIIKAIGF
jgi:hypothetical protein